MSWVATAVGVIEGGSAIYGAIAGNQTHQRNKGYIDDAYRTAQARMQAEQNYGRESNLESLNARGMLSGGVSPIQAAMTSGASSATDLGGQSRAELEREYGLDQKSLDAQHQQARNENNAQYLNTLVGAGEDLAGAVAGGFSTKMDLNAMKSLSLPKGPQSSPIASAMLSGSAYDGIHPVDPLGDASSAWHLPGTGTSLGNGQSNAAFNTGLG